MSAGGVKRRPSAPVLMATAVMIAVGLLLLITGFGGWRGRSGEPSGPRRWVPEVQLLDPLVVAQQGPRFDGDPSDAPVVWPERRRVMACDVLDLEVCDE